jgi:NADH dehydrogenase [ubiquinone] 1 alpha subcomplex assembly factor 7
MSPLETELRRMIAQDGPLPLERYMQLALTHPTHGYYLTRDPIGAGGDFITAPEISQMFGELCGLWAAEVWVALGSPTPLRLIELGPGRGTLMVDALRAAQVSRDFNAALDVHLVEISPALEARQRQALVHAGSRVHWHQTIDTIPDGPCIIFANEFFDALPVRHYIKTARGWCERLVGVDEQDRLVLGSGDVPEPDIKVDAPYGTLLEIAAAAQVLMNRLAVRIAKQGGALLMFDYGHTRTAFGESLQALKGHDFTDPLRDAGEADLTTHVDFAALGRAARAAGTIVHGPLGQGAFLVNLGIVQRANALKRRASTTQIEAIDRSLRRLTGTSEEDMGTLFKAMGVGHRDLAALPGFPAASEAAA